MVDRILFLLWHRLFFVFLTLFISGFGTNIDGSTQSTPLTTTGSSAALPSSTNVVSSPATQPGNPGKEESPSQFCPSNVECHKLGARCVVWDNMNNSCIYGKTYNTTCTAMEGVNCTGKTTFECQYQCRYCYQLEPWEYRCNASTCPINTPRKTWPARPFYIALCSPKDHIFCLGHRDFYRQKDCNWTSGYKWSTALILSITLGGFGADRFYLGLWREGIGKLFSFGGLGVWTLVDVILIAVGYVGPADGSLYI